MASLAWLPFAAVAFCAVIWGCAVAGRWLGERELRDDPEGARLGTGAVEGAVFGLLGLLMAFTFDGAADRMSVRRDLVTDEANAIGTAWLRLDLLDGADSDAMRPRFREYVEARLRLAEDFRSSDSLSPSERTSQQLQAQIWRESVSAVQRLPNPEVGPPLLEALNEMIDIAGTRAVRMRTHPSAIIYLLLGLLTMAATFLAGFGMAGRKSGASLHMWAFICLLTATLYVTVDLEFPRFGLIQIGTADRSLVQLRGSMGD